MYPILNFTWEDLLSFKLSLCLSSHIGRMRSD